MSKSIFSLKNKTIWVFGGAGHLGQPVVLLLRSLGANILCVDLYDRSQCFVNSLGIEKKTIFPDSLDVNNIDQLKSFVHQKIDAFGVPDGLVNMTYSTTSKRMEDLNEDDFDYVNHGGLTSVFILSKEVGLKMSEKGRGSIVLFSSMYGITTPYPDVYKEPMVKNPIEYGVNKAGVIQMARYMAVHWGKEKVRCNCISPGPFPNPNIQHSFPDFIKELNDKSPMGRIGAADEIAGSVAFLLSDASSYITGHNLIVDGGWTCW